jgi:hypothetical protein
MSVEVPGIDFGRLTPWFREHVAPVGDLSATIIGHGNCVHRRLKSAA